MRIRRFAGMCIVSAVLLQGTCVDLLQRSIVNGIFAGLEAGVLDGVADAAAREGAEFADMVHD